MVSSQRRLFFGGNLEFRRRKKVLQVVQIGERGGGNLDKIQKNSSFFLRIPSLNPDEEYQLKFVCKSIYDKTTFPFILQPVESESAVLGDLSLSLAD